MAASAPADAVPHTVSVSGSAAHTLLSSSDPMRSSAAASAASRTRVHSPARGQTMPKYTPPVSSPASDTVSFTGFSMRQ